MADNNNMAMMALVAIVAVVGVVGLIMQSTTLKAPAQFDVSEENMLGDARSFADCEFAVGEDGKVNRNIIKCYEYDGDVRTFMVEEDGVYRE